MKDGSPGLALAATVLLAVPALAVGCADALPDEIWGGEHVQIQTTDAGAHLEFDCATGTIEERLQADAQGRFSLAGTFTPEHGGPVRIGEEPTTVDATYSGTIENETMRLHVRVGGQDGREDDYVLTRGRAGKVMKCR